MVQSVIMKMKQAVDTKVAVLVSGGVDSSVALRLLQQQGYQVTAFYLKIWLEDELSYLGDCPWQEDLAYVEQVCAQAGVPLEVMSLQKEYHEQVVTYTIEQVKKGRTPNPDILCNSRIKFGLFLDAISDQFDYVASGHYAQLAHTADGVQLRCAPDDIKDQTYFLSHLNQHQLQRLMFPIGHLRKQEVRALAQQFNLPNKARKDSQGICFLGKFKFRDFIKHHLGVQSGPMIELETGDVVGQHDGFWFYTIGQRQGLKLSGGPWYVVKKEPERNIVYISRSYYTDDKARNQFTIAQPHWITTGVDRHNLQVKLRHGPHRHACTLRDGDTVMLAQRDQGIAPGQFAVFYAGDICLGGGVIEQAL